MKKTLNYETYLSPKALQKNVFLPRSFADTGSHDSPHRPGTHHVAQAGLKNLSELLVFV